MTVATGAKNHWGRCLDKNAFNILGELLPWGGDAASNSPTLFSSKRYAQLYETYIGTNRLCYENSENSSYGSIDCPIIWLLFLF